VSLKAADDFGKWCCFSVMLPLMVSRGVQLARPKWLAERHMGVPDAASCYVSEFKSNGGSGTKEYQNLTSKVMK
jgi:hypothetical protein